MIGDSLTAAILQKALDGTWQRQKAISNNIANYETPGYKAMNVSFEDSLDREVNRLRGKAMNAEEISKGKESIRNADISVASDYATLERADGNNVNMELENIEMAKTQIQYQYLTRSMSDMFSRLRYAISEGKK
ncbi:flagellar basal body rod protein FlgB [Sinanaerobacter chloroacetimidivorans]|uniref:Flagellar basal body rod protein FlgB n=1 Tax=Sinanaerobacter chloroacetimidivorans TaxID=2818044 RepID=A0A8J7W1M2_9FIRM|nr:flagellar basal body rod protein FlgB [Sinanaerobacter chloroacetimidivorans]MBR0597525.1 flagellar basal body rod protein FlgB [Sinanaerobacter chloroacetimidivorans]